jgi:hypothetical protein
MRIKDAALVLIWLSQDRKEDRKRGRKAIIKKHSLHLLP